MRQENFYQTAFLSALASSLITPFIPMYALRLGATKTMIGLISALTSFLSILSGLFWAALVESSKRRVMFVILGYLLWGIFWIPIAFCKDSLQLLLILSFQAILSAMITPAWQSMLVNVTSKFQRGRFVSKVNLASSIGSFIGSLIGGYIIYSFGFVPFLFYSITFYGIISGFPFLPSIAEKFNTYGRDFYRSLKSLFNIHEIRKNKEFSRLVRAMLFLNFAVSIAGPMFSVYILQNLKGNSVNLTILAIIDTIVAVLFFKPWGVLVDYLGRKTVLVGCLLPIAFFPFIYFISNNIIWLYLYEFIGSLFWGGFNIAIFSYLSDVIPKGSEPTFLSFYNFLVGVSSVLGSLVSGLLADLIGIKYVFLISFFLRLISSPLFYALGERKGTRPSGILRATPIENISYQLESTILIYTQVLKEARRNTLESWIKRLLRSGLS